jgi:hypothetical protein
MPVQNYGAIMQGAADLTAMPANAFAQGQQRKQAQEYRNSLLGMDQQRLSMDQQKFDAEQEDDEEDRALYAAWAKGDWATADAIDPVSTMGYRMKQAELQKMQTPEVPKRDIRAVGGTLLEVPQEGDPRVLYRAPEKPTAPQAAPKPGYGSPQPGVNPQTGKPDQFVVDDMGGVKWLGVSPVPSAQESTATVAATKKAQSSKDVLAILDEAEPIISQATGSYGGYVADQAARIFGASTDGAKATAKLKALQAALMLKMPRMEGPQSNLDVQMYREAAGQIGDPTVPADTKLAAVQSIRSLNEKYAGVAPSGGAKPPSGPKPGDVVKGYRFKGGDPSKKENWVKQ